MDMIKMGRFLQTLRKENGMTQEQLAQRLGVARRTVSRWETGNNLPDMDILLELSELYAVELRELICGERKHAVQEAAAEETVHRVIDYSFEEKSALKRRMHALFMTGAGGFLLAMLVDWFALPYPFLVDLGLGSAFGVILVGIIFTGKHAARIRKWKVNLLNSISRKDHPAG